MAAQQSFRSALNGFNREDVVHFIKKTNTQHTNEINQLKSELKYLQDKLAQLESQPAPVEETPSPAVAELEQQLEEQAQRIRDLFDRCRDAEAARDAALEEKQAAEVLCAEAEADRAHLKTELEAVQAEQQAVPPISQEAEAEILQLKAELEAAQAEKHAANAQILRLKAELEVALNQQAAAAARKDEELAAYRRAERVERQAKERAEQMCRQIDGALADTTVKVDEAAAHLGEMANQVLQQLSQLQLAVSGSNLMLKDAAASLYAIRPAAEEE